MQSGCVSPLNQSTIPDISEGEPGLLRANYRLSDVYGKSKARLFHLCIFEPYPVIATTSELLSTGADCKMTKLIVLG
jgi:hypothetical protein